MATRITLLAALIFTASAARGTQLDWTPQLHPVPVIPHGLDWDIQLAPDPKPIIAKLSDEEVAQILPLVLKLEQSDIQYDFARFGSSSNESLFGPITAILIGSVFLLASYDLIPRLHRHMLRFRSADLRHNLLS